MVKGLVSTFTVFAIFGQQEASGTGTAVRTHGVLACVLAETARRRPAFINIWAAQLRVTGLRGGSLYPLQCIK